MCRAVLLLLLLAPVSSLTLFSKKTKLGNEEGGCDRKGKFAQDWRKSYVARQPSGEIESPNMWAIHPTDAQHEAQVQTIHNFWAAVDPDPNFQNAGMVEPGFKVNDLPDIKTSKAFSVKKTAVHKHGQSLYHYAATHFLGQGALKGKDILEVGMGKGLGAAYLSQAFGPKSVEGVDLSDGHVALARSYFPSSEGRLQFVQGHAEHLAQASNSKDFVFDLDNAHMYRSPKKSLSEAFRVLKPGGKYIYASALPVGRSLAEHKRSFQQAGFRVERGEDATSKVIASRDQLAADMPPSEFAELCTSCLTKMAIGSPLNLWEMYLLPGSKGYSMMEKREYIYVHLMAVKP
jgi:SAM-dependent methyltransferase